MKFVVEREAILSPLQAVIGVVERRQTMPILANVLLAAKGQTLSLTATDLEVELVAQSTASIQEEGETTLPGRKLLDILRALPEKAAVSIAIDSERATLRSGKSRFTLATLPPSEFPVVENIEARQLVRLPQVELKSLLEKTHFSMAQQDVRYYLNGMLLELNEQVFRVVATDGHRLALAEIEVAQALQSQQVILPRKGVLELHRILDNQGDVQVAIGANHVQVEIGRVRFTSKLIDGRFPEYSRVIPNAPPRIIITERLTLRAALQRAAILSNEKYRGIRVTLKPGAMLLQAHNPEQEEAEEELEIRYEGELLEIGFNVNYLLEALAALNSENVELGFTDGNSSCLLRSPEATHTKYVVMPMRL